MEEIGRLVRARRELAVGKRHRVAVGIAVGNVADGRLVGIERATARYPVVQIPGKNPLSERYALQFLDIAQRAKRRVSNLHRISIPTRRRAIPPILCAYYFHGQPERSSSVRKQRERRSGVHTLAIAGASCRLSIANMFFQSRLVAGSS